MAGQVFRPLLQIGPTVVVLLMCAGGSTLFARDDSDTTPAGRPKSKDGIASLTNSKPTPPRIEEIIEGIRHWQQSLAVISVRYAYVEELNGGAYFHRKPGRTRTRLIDYRIAGRRLLSREATILVNNIPVTHNSPFVYVDDEVVVKWWPNGRWSLETPFKENGLSVKDFSWGCEWFEALGYLPQTSDAPIVGDFYLPFALEKHNYSIEESPQVIGDRQCWVLERDQIDRIWLDPTRGFVPVRREWRPTRDEQSVYRAHNFILWDYREIASGMWLPWITRREVLTDDINDPSRLRKDLVCNTYVGDIDLNDHAVRPDYLPGTVVTVQKGGRVERERLLPGGQELLDEIAARHAIQGNRSSLMQRSQFVPAALLILQVACVVILAFRVRRLGSSANRV